MGNYEFFSFSLPGGFFCHRGDTSKGLLSGGGSKIKGVGGDSQTLVKRNLKTGKNPQ